MSRKEDRPGWARSLIAFLGSWWLLWRRFPDWFVETNTNLERLKIYYAEQFSSLTEKTRKRSKRRIDKAERLLDRAEPILFTRPKRAKRLCTKARFLILKAHRILLGAAFSMASRARLDARPRLSRKPDSAWGGLHRQRG